jgi:primosomal protein N' (replication factor Y)
MTVRNLRLKAEVVKAAAQPPSGVDVVAECWVDTGVAHLDSHYSYLIPGNLDATIKPGVFVVVPFNGRELTAVVLRRVPLVGAANLKSILKTMGEIPLLTDSIRSLIEAICKRYAAHPFDVIPSAIPSRVVSVEKSFGGTFPADSRKIRENIQYLQLPPHRDRFALIASSIAASVKNGGVLVLLPELRDVHFLANALSELKIEFVVLESSQSKSDRYSAFLATLAGDAKIVIGTRTSIFAPVSNLSHIYVFNEGSEHYYERRSPGWNVRDVALIRARQSGIPLTFIGYSPSTEIARLIDEGLVTYKRSRARIRVSTFAQIHGELLPSKSLTLLKKAISLGPVLALVPSKGYAQAIRCAKCRTISRCQCGGALQKSSAHSAITCAHCATQFPQWSCTWCHHRIPALVSRGIERHQQEIGLLFPNTPIHFSTAEHAIEVAESNGIYLATPGMAPTSQSGYAAILILEGNKFLNQSDMRAHERVRELYFSAVALARTDAPVILIQDEGDVIVTAISSWSPSLSVHQDLQERKSLQLPPYTRSAVLSMKSSEIVRLKSALESAISEDRIPIGTRIFGPIEQGEKSSLLLSVPTEQGEALIATLHEFIRRRSISKKELPSLRIDPYSLNL